MVSTEGWSTRQRILVFLAHPDDPEFFLGATIARWTSMEHEVRYCLLTRGDKGSNDPSMDPGRLAAVRELEQRAAAKVLGVSAVAFLDYKDGSLVPSMETRKAAARIIRQERPQVLVTSDPTNYFPNDFHINHPDHRAAGQIVSEGLFPAAGNPLFFPELLQEGLQPFMPSEVWYAIPALPNTALDVTENWERKILALHEHKSQIGDPAKLEARMRKRHTADSTPEKPRYEEVFKRIIFPK